jgi:hypothetical protein
VLYAAVRKTIEQDLDNGQPTGRRVLRKSQEDVVWNRFSCVISGAQFERSDDIIVQLQEEVKQLRLQLALLTGQLVPENQLPC